MIFVSHFHYHYTNLDGNDKRRRRRKEVFRHFFLDGYINKCCTSYRSSVFIDVDRPEKGQVS